MEINPYALSVADQLDALRRASDEENWGIPKGTLKRLTATATAWPKGRRSFRSFRIRFDEGDAGVERTFDAHMGRIEAVLGAEHFKRGDDVRAGTKHLRLLAGNATHRPTVEWVNIDLHKHNRYPQISVVRGPKSLADELLVFTWLFPEFVPDLCECNDWRHCRTARLIAAGYELTVSPFGQWGHAPYVHLYRREDDTPGCLHFASRDNNRACNQIPEVM